VNYGQTGGKRQREANRDRKKREKEERLRRNRAMRAQGIEPPSDEPGDASSAQQLPEVKLEDIIISGVAPRGPKGSNGSPKLFVGGLSWDTGREALESAFARFGTIVEATVVTDRATGRSRGFGFVTFENALQAAEAAKQMNGAELDGRTLKVNPADRR
jgi:RNA recognition motif-containing protein